MKTLNELVKEHGLPLEVIDIHKHTYLILSLLPEDIYEARSGTMPRVFLPSDVPIYDLNPNIK